VGLELDYLINGGVALSVEVEVEQEGFGARGLIEGCIDLDDPVGNVVSGDLFDREGDIVQDLTFALGGQVFRGKFG